MRNVVFVRLPFDVFGDTVRHLLCAVPCCDRASVKLMRCYRMLCSRPSEDLDRIRAKIAAIGKAHGFDVATDKGDVPSLPS